MTDVVSEPDVATGEHTAEGGEVQAAMGRRPRRRLDRETVLMLVLPPVLVARRPG